MDKFLLGVTYQTVKRKKHEFFMIHFDINETRNTIYKIESTLNLLQQIYVHGSKYQHFADSTIPTAASGKEGNSARNYYYEARVKKLRNFD